jgi:hypothetical protein
MNILPVIVAAGLLVPACALATEQNDLREFRVGMAVSALPETGYSGFTCAGEPLRKLSGWGDYRACPAQPDGNRVVSFRYGGSAPGDEDGARTEVGGQPVSLALLIDDNARVSGIRIETDPHTRLYMHKKAFLFGLQVRARFGEDGWSCRQTAPTPTEQPVGGVFIHEHCEKITPTRHFTLDRQLFRDPAKDLRDFTDATQVTIGREGLSRAAVN